MKFFGLFGKDDEEQPEERIEWKHTEVSGETFHFECDTVAFPTPAGYCKSCGFPIDDHPRGYGLACDTWYQ